MPRIVSYWDNETGEERKAFYVRAKEACERDPGRYSFQQRKAKPPVSAKDDKAAKASKAAKAKEPAETPQEEPAAE